MFRLNRKAQTTAEYAILIAVVVGALVGMQIYVRRGLQGRIRDVVDSSTAISVPEGGGQTGAAIGATFSGNQFEPYYLGTGNIAQTTSGARSQSGSTENLITHGEEAYTTDRTGSRASAYGLNIEQP